MGNRRDMAPDIPRRLDPSRHAEPCNGHARALDPVSLDDRNTAIGRLAPALCINRGERRGPKDIPGPEGTTQTAGRTTGSDPGAFPTGVGDRIRGGSAVTTDRLITPFMCLKAQSGPRMV